MNFVRAGQGRWHLSELRTAIHCLLQYPTASVPSSVVSTFKGLHLQNLLGDFQATIKILYYQISKILLVLSFVPHLSQSPQGITLCCPNVPLPLLLTPTPFLRFGPSSSTFKEFSLTFPSTSNRLTATVFP